MKIVFRILEPFSAHFSSKFAKSADRSITFFVVVNIQYGYTEMMNLMLILNLLKNLAKKFTQNKLQVENVCTYL
jgi:hypothetical protein